MQHGVVLRVFLLLGANVLKPAKPRLRLRQLKALVARTGWVRHDLSSIFDSLSRERLQLHAFVYRKIEIDVGLLGDFLVLVVFLAAKGQQSGQLAPLLHFRQHRVESVLIQNVRLRQIGGVPRLRQLFIFRDIGGLMHDLHTPRVRILETLDRRLAYFVCSVELEDFL